MYLIRTIEADKYLLTNKSFLDAAPEAVSDSYVPARKNLKINFSKLKKSFKKLYRKEQKRIIYQSNARKGYWKIVDKLTPLSKRRANFVPTQKVRDRLNAGAERSAKRIRAMIELRRKNGIIQF